MLCAEAATPILVLSAHDDLRLKVRALDLGADDYMTKPFAAEEKLGHRTYSQPGAGPVSLGMALSDNHVPPSTSGPRPCGGRPAV
jgi:two-component system KDP operon response regulator KdpE